MKTAGELANIASASLKKLLHAPVKEKEEARVKPLESVKVCKEELVKARTNVASNQASVAFDLYCKLLADDIEAHWDQIVSDMHTKDPWTDLIGVKHKGMRPWTQDSLKVCSKSHSLHCRCCGKAKVLLDVPPQEACEVHHTSACRLYGSPQQVCGINPYHQEQPQSCCLH